MPPFTGELLSFMHPKFETELRAFATKETFFISINKLSKKFVTVGSQNLLDSKFSCGSMPEPTVVRVDVCPLTPCRVARSLAQPNPVAADFCGIEDEDLLGYNHPVDGNMPVSARSIRVTRGYRVTAIATEVVNDDTVAFLGTSNGYLRKVLCCDGAG